MIGWGILMCISFGFIFLNYVPILHLFRIGMDSHWLIFWIILGGLADFFSGCVIGVFASVVLCSMVGEKFIKMANGIQKMRPTFCLAICVISVVASSFAVVSVENSTSQAVILVLSWLVMFICGLFFTAQYLVKNHLANIPDPRLTPKH